MKYLTFSKVFFLSISLFLVVVSTLEAQQINVINKRTNEPVVNVAVYNNDKSISAITNFDGQVNLSQFDSSEMLYFKHISYQLKSILKSQIEANRIYLEPNTHGLDEIVISASKFEQNKRDVAQKVASINANNIAFTNPQTSADLLESTGQVYIQKSQLGGGSPMIRGFSTNRLLLSVDGVRMNNAIFRGGNLQNVISIDPFAIQNTEVVLGAGAVIYGSDAIGGVMSFYTKKPILSHTDSLRINSEAVVRYATANEEKTAHLGLNLGYKKWGFLTHASYTDFNDLRIGSNGPNDYLRPEYVSTENGEDVIVENNNPKLQVETG
jgi:hemoglobin/transferrin/lactoferrin receptor protein